LKDFLFVIVALQVARKIASCNMAFSLGLFSHKSSSTNRVQEKVNPETAARAGHNFVVLR